MNTSGAIIKVNFGRTPFTYKGYAQERIEPFYTSHWASILSDIPVTQGHFQFETRIISSEKERPLICVGVARTSKIALNEPPGVSESSVAIYSLTGNVFHNGHSNVYGAGFSVGDVISTYIDSQNGVVAFAKNGVYLGEAYKFNLQKTYPTLYPIVSIATPNVVININFGTAPLRFPLAFGENRILPFCRYDISEEYVKTTEIFMETFNAGYQFKVSDNAVLSPAIKLFIRAVQDTTPIAIKLLSGRESLLKTEQLLLDEIVRLGLINLRKLLSDKKLSAMVPYILLDPLMEVPKETGLEKDNEAEFSISAFKVLFAAFYILRWPKFSKPTQSIKYIRVLLNRLPNLAENRATPALCDFYACTIAFFEHLVEMLDLRLIRGVKK